MCGYLFNLELTYIQDLAIQAKVASVIGANVFDRVFAGVRFAETDGPLLYVYPSREIVARVRIKRVVKLQNPLP